MMRVPKIIPIFIITVLATVTYGTEPSDTIPQPDSTIVDTTTVSPDSVLHKTKMDTLLYQPGTQMFRYADITDTTNYEQHLVQNPTKALFKSMLIPGWGQMGNRKYIKALVFFSVDVWMIRNAVHYGRQASDLRKEFENAATIEERNTWYSLYLDQKDQRNKYTWFAVIVSFLSMFDAYVDAHLSGFPEKQPDNSVSLSISPDNKGGVYTSITIPF